MSVKVSSWVWHDVATGELAGNELVLLLSLADVADDNGRCRFLADETDLTYAALARKARVSRSTVIRMVAKLREQGLVEHVPGVKGRPNEFRVVVPWAQSSGSNLEPNGLSGGSDSVSTATDSVSTESGFGVNPDSRTSLRRIDVNTRVSSSDADASDGGELTPTGRPKKPKKVASDFDPEVLRLCGLLAELVRRNDHRVETVEVRWWNACRLLHEVDGYSWEQIETIIRWSTADPFWSGNIRSMPTLREKFSTLRARRNQELEQKRSRVGTVQHGANVDEILRAREAAAERLAVGS